MYRARRCNASNGAVRVRVGGPLAEGLTEWRGASEVGNPACR
jgi:hypothetical protein